MTEPLVLRLEPSWDPTWAEIQVSPAYHDDLKAALDGADVDNGPVLKLSAGEHLVSIGVYATATATMFRALTPALKAFLSRHDNKEVEIKVGDESTRFTGFRVKDVEKVLEKAEELRIKRAQQREIGGETT